MTKAVTVNIIGIKTYAADFFEQAVKNRKKILLAVMFVFGLWCGTNIFISNSSAFGDMLDDALQMLIDAGTAKGFLYLLLVNISLITITFFSGFFALGLPMTLICPCASGVAIGGINAWIFSAFRLNGVFFSLIGIIPFAVISTILLLVSCNESIILSSKIAKAVLFAEAGSRGEVKGFLIRHMIIFAVFAVCTIIQTLIITKLGGKLLSI